MDIEQWLNIIRTRRNLEPGSLPTLIDEESKIYLWESINVETLNDEVMLVYDCSKRDSMFDYDKFMRLLSEKEEAIQPIMIFNNWDQEREVYWDYYDIIEKAADKKSFSQWFEKKTSIYTDCCTDIMFHIEDQGINYLEYPHSKSEKDLKGRIYNMSFFELKKLFNVTGVHLFSNNVRYGLKKHATGELLKKKFRQYICGSVYKTLTIEHELTSDQKEQISEILEIEPGETIDLSENFWFYHNGVTIFCSDSSKFETPINKLKLQPNNVSVINGAQTLTNFFSEVEYVRRNLLELIKDIIEIPDSKELMDNLIKRIFVKTIIIIGETNYVEPITRGLNTQIPILEEALLASSDEVESINKILTNQTKTKIKILKEGESWSGEGISVLDFAKHWFTIEKKPGRSKNLGKKNLDYIFKEILKKIKVEKYAEVFFLRLELLLSVYRWWESSKKSRLNLNVKNPLLDSISRYGKNYFGTYVVSSISTIEELDDTIKEFDDIKMIMLYEQFEKDLIETNIQFDLKDFKNDVLSEKMLEQRNLCQVEIKNQSLKSEVVLTKEKLEELKELLRKDGQNAYTFSKTISHYLFSHNINIEYFRVINRLNNKCKEAFPFPNSTFTEIFTTESNKYLEFHTSTFYTEIQKTYPVFIIDKNKENDIENIYINAMC